MSHLVVDIVEDIYCHYLWYTIDNNNLTFLSMVNLIPQAYSY